MKLKYSILLLASLTCFAPLYNKPEDSVTKEFLKFTRRQPGETFGAYLARITEMNNKLTDILHSSVEVQLNKESTKIKDMKVTSVDSDEGGVLISGMPLQKYSQDVMLAAIKKLKLKDDYLANDFAFDQFLSKWRSYDDTAQRSEAETKALVKELVDEVIEENAGFMEKQYN